MVTPKTIKELRVDPIGFEPIVDDKKAATPFFARQWQNLVNVVSQIRDAVNAIIIIEADIIEIDADIARIDATTVTGVGALGGGGAIGSGNLTITHDNTAVTPASYTNANITVDQQGHITAASNGSAAANTIVFEDEGTPVVTAGTVNFAGSGVTVTNVAGVATVTIPGGSSGSSVYGAMATRATNQAIGVSTDTPVQFTTETYDDSTFIDLATHNTRITIPTGFNRAILFMEVFWDAVGGNKFQQIWKNGVGTWYGGQPSEGRPGGSQGSDRITCSTGVLAVTAGDYFEAVVLTAAAHNVNPVSFSIIAWNVP